MFMLRYARQPLHDVTNEKGPKMKRDIHEAKRRGSAGSGQTIRRDDMRAHAANEKHQSLTQKSSQPVTIPAKHTSKHVEAKRRSRASQRRESDSHDKAALSPSVAALLAVTAIPPRRRGKRRSEPQLPVSIDQLVQEWRAEALASPAIGSHKSMEILLDVDEDVVVESLETVDQSLPETLMTSRSTSSDTVPSLDADNRSFLSLDNPPTPEAMTADGGDISPRRSRPRPSMGSVKDVLDHPLAFESDDDAEDLPPSPPTKTPDSAALLDLAVDKTSTKTKSRFTSNLTLSLQTLKSRAISSLSNLTLHTGPGESVLENKPYAYSDQQLWSHPYLFPRFSPEIRPSPFKTTPSESERRYLNPPHPHQLEDGIQLSIEDHSSHYCAALHTPQRVIARGEQTHRGSSPMIQMVTYNRPTRKQTSSKAPVPRSADPNSEAGRAMSTPTASQVARQREPRENSDFLRVVVLEMNMRRSGKLEDGIAGRARIWLPPRRSSSLLIDEGSEGGRSRRKRWDAMSADD